MTKKLILLILALPLFLMICLFTATSGVSLAVPISVSGIELLSESTVFMDLDDPKEKHLVEYAVYPTNAANQDVTLSYLPLDSEDGKAQPLAQFEYDEETGYLKPLAPGAAEVVITTVDGGYSVRFTVIVETRELVSIESSHPNLDATFDEALAMDKYSLAPGDTFKIENKFTPETASSLLVTYESSNPAVATVNGRGVVQARSAGTTIITVTSRSNEYIKYSFAIEITNPDDQAFVIIDKNIVTSKISGRIDMSITTDEEYEVTATVVDSEGNPIPDANKYILVMPNISTDGSYVGYYFGDDNYYGTVFIDVTLTTEYGVTTTVRCSVTKVAVSDEDKLHIVFDNDKDYYDMYLQENQLFFQVLPEREAQDLSFNVISDSKNVLVENKVYDMGDGYYSIIVDPQLVGTSNITLEVTNNETKEVTTKVVPIVVKPRTILAHNTVYGIESSFTIGKYNADGTLFNYVLQYTINDKIGENFYENLVWESSSDAVYVNELGRIVFVEGKEISDFVTFTLKYYCGDSEVARSQSIRIRCVSNGYNVYSYKELLEVTRAGKVVVLQKDIVHDFGADLEKSKNLESQNRKEKTVVLLPNDQIYTTMKSTYDITWYENSGIADQANIKVLISFKDDVYGNGHIINADNVVAYGQWKSFASNGQPNLEADAIFRGPLSFVALSDGKGNGGAVTVAAQDNVCFAAFEGVKLNNIELIGRNMDADGDGNYNLQGLHYAGTTVEVFGDDVTIEYSRVKNGRNVVRAFGDAEDPNKSINLTVTNSVLSNGRDFIMRLGSNRFVNMDLTSDAYKDTPVTDDTLSPHIPDLNPNDKVNYLNRHNYNSFTEEEKNLYDKQFINTYVTINNSVLEDPGIFGIGVDTHFAGTALENGDAFRDFAGDSDALLAWRDLAKTGYGVKLTLSGDVRMYCWKILDQVDSTSLIETLNGFSLGLLNAESLAFNIPDLVRAAVSRNPNLVNAIHNVEVSAEAKSSGSAWMSIWNKDANQDGIKEMQQYDKVHAGIVFFGGGKNYGVLEYDNFDFYEFSKPYEISLEDAGRYELTLAAGKEDFYFIIYDSTTLNFLYETQEQMRKDPEQGYSCLKK